MSPALQHHRHREAAAGAAGWAPYVHWLPRHGALGV